MEHAQDLDRYTAHPVGYDVVRLDHEQFTGSRHSTRSTESWLRRQLRNGIEYALDHETRGRRVVSSDVGGFVVEVAQRLTKPPNPHSLATSW